MKVVVLYGGLGTRLSEETQTRPKPMVEIGGRPILWHILRIYDHFGLRDFVLALGYKGEIVRNYFLNYRSQQCDVTVQLKTGNVEFSNPTVEDWNMNLIDTGARTETGGRLRRGRRRPVRCRNRSATNLVRRNPNRGPESWGTAWIPPESRAWIRDGSGRR